MTAAKQIKDTPHRALCERAALWLVNSKGCNIAAFEIVAYTNEKPDAVGFKPYRSFVIECKTSRADFLRDAKKLCRQVGRGMGNRRYYLCPPGIIKQEDLPMGWGLLYLHGKQVRTIVEALEQRCNIDDERTLLVSISRRLLEGCPYLRAKIVPRKRAEPMTANPFEGVK